ncbi:helicase C-terminal domain-containing protein, partial [Staphylococcus caprae]|uniref:helicase C-terminal domain-containing protein n=1 Tax=Staphylococcus caprae TaxID=29380 RepID=UPI0030C3D79E
LIRSEDDQGIIVSFDNRLTTSNYRKFFTQALESYHQRQGNIKQFEKILSKLSNK